MKTDLDRQLKFLTEAAIEFKYNCDDPFFYITIGQDVINHGSDIKEDLHEDFIENKIRVEVDLFFDENGKFINYLVTLRDKEKDEE